MDLSKLSDQDLEAISRGDMASVSDEGLRLIAGDQKLAPEPKEKPTFAQAAMPEMARPEFRSELGRQAGIAARMPVAAGASLLGMAGDPLNALVNLIIGGANKATESPTLSSLITGQKTGLNIPKLQTIGGATENLMTQAGLPEPREGLERGLYNVGTATMSAAFPGTLAARLAKQTSPISQPSQVAQRLEPTFAAQAPAAAARMFTEGPSLQATGAFGGAAASQLAAQAGAGPAGQFISGLAGGVLAPGATSIGGGRAVSGGREAVRPFTEEGRNVIAGQVLRKLSSDPDAAIARADQFVPRVPVYQPTTAQATRDVGLISAEPAIRAMDTGGRFIAQQSAANQARMKILDRMAKDKESLAAAQAKRDAVTDPLRESAFARSTVAPETFQSSVVLTANKKIDDILNSPAGRRQTVIDVMNDAKADIARARTPAELYEIRKDLRLAERGLLSKAEKNGPSSDAYKAARPQLNEVIRAVDDAIEAAAPGYRDYLNKYAKASKGISSMEEAQNFRAKVLGVTPDPMSSEYMISQPSFTRAIRSLDKGDFKDLSSTQVATLKRIGRDLDDGVLNRAGKMPGSDTFKNLSTANFIGGIVGKQVFGEMNPALQSKINPFNWMYNGSDDMIRDLLVEAMLDPKLASQLMAKASVIRMEPLSQELQRKAIGLGYGSAFGLEQ